MAVLFFAQAGSPTVYIHLQKVDISADGENRTEGLRAQQAMHEAAIKNLVSTSLAFFFIFEEVPPYRGDCGCGRIMGGKRPCYSYYTPTTHSITREWCDMETSSLMAVRRIRMGAGCWRNDYADIYFRL